VSVTTPASPALSFERETRELRRYRQFYLTYPQIRESPTPKLGVAVFSHENIGQMNTYTEGA
jgi:hypothetical protein